MRNANSQFETALLCEANKTEGTNIRNPKKSHLSNHPVPRERHRWPFRFLEATCGSPFLSSEVASSSGHGSESAPWQGRA